MAQTKKFSQFTNGGDLIAGDTLVGLRNGVNTYFNTPDTLTPIEIISVTQAAHGFIAGNWVYRNVGGYALAKADTETTAQAVGVVIEVVDANTFKLQQSGYSTGGLTGLTDGTMYYISPTTAGAITSTKPTAAGQFNKPVLIATSPTSGWILSHRSLDATTASSSAVTMNVTQAAHGFVLGNILYRNGGTNLYALAQASSASLAETVGMVVDVIDVNTFTLQEIGYVTGLAGLVDGTVYFLDPSVAGAMTATEPTTSGQISKPMFIADSTTSGWFLHYRGMAVGGGSTTGGQVVQEVFSISTTPSSTTALIPWDNTIPQNTEGAEFDTVTITPTDGTNQLIIEFNVGVSATSAAQLFTIALFQDSNADALQVIDHQTGAINWDDNQTLRYVMTAGTTSPTTFKIRYGNYSAGTCYLNQSSAGAVFGGASSSTFSVKEVTPGIGTGLTAGQIVQVVSNVDNTASSTTALIPWDNTIPQNTEGAELMTLSITPQSATNILVIDFTAGVTATSAAQLFTMALFQDSTADAIQVIDHQTGAINWDDNQTMRYVMTAGTTSATTFKIRYGNYSAGTCYVNQSSAGAKFGGAASSVMTITEIQA